MYATRSSLTKLSRAEAVHCLERLPLLGSAAMGPGSPYQDLLPDILISAKEHVDVVVNPEVALSGIECGRRVCIELD